MDLYPFFLFVSGLIVITVGSELLLKGASKIASLFGVPPILIGLTVVSIGTSLPELAVGITAIQDGASDIAIGNIAGTNIVNILLILGLSTAIKPLPVNLKSVKFEIIVMIIAALLLFFLCLDGKLSYAEGVLMFLLGIVYIILLIKKSRKESFKVKKEFEEEYGYSQGVEKKDWKKWLFYSAILLLGMVGTIYGADLLVAGAVDIARAFGMSDAVIGLTIVAIGTSVPELATTIVATLKDDRDVAMGNLLGSSITNILFILAITSLFVPEGLKVSRDIIWIDLLLGAVVAILCYPVFKSDRMVSRREGVAFVSAYILYVFFLLFFRT